MSPFFRASRARFCRYVARHDVNVPWHDVIADKTDPTSPQAQATGRSGPGGEPIWLQLFPDRVDRRVRPPGLFTTGEIPTPAHGIPPIQHIDSAGVNRNRLV
jgi:hypothetical protein